LVYYDWLVSAGCFLPRPRRTSSDFFAGGPHRYGFVSISIAAPLTTQQLDGDSIEFSIMILFFVRYLAGFFSSAGKM